MFDPTRDCFKRRYGGVRHARGRDLATCQRGLTSLSQSLRLAFVEYAASPLDCLMEASFECTILNRYYDFGLSLWPEFTSSSRRSRLHLGKVAYTGDVVAGQVEHGAAGERAVGEARRRARGRPERAGEEGPWLRVRVHGVAPLRF